MVRRGSLHPASARRFAASSDSIPSVSLSSLRRSTRATGASVPRRGRAGRGTAPWCITTPSLASKQTARKQMLRPSHTSPRSRLAPVDPPDQLHRCLGQAHSSEGSCSQLPAISSHSEEAGLPQLPRRLGPLCPHQPPRFDPAGWDEAFSTPAGGAASRTEERDPFGSCATASRCASSRGLHAMHRHRLRPCGPVELALTSSRRAQRRSR